MASQTSHIRCYLNRLIRHSVRVQILLVSLPLLLAPLPSTAENSLAIGSGNADAALNFRIVIPAVIHVLENSHPHEIIASASGALSAQQRLVILTNMKRGFCVVLRQDNPQLIGWRLQTVQEGGISVSLVAGSYRLCIPRSGRYKLLIKHEFQVHAGADALLWPVQTDLTAI